MPLISNTATLLIIDLQERLLPVIAGHDSVLRNARTLSAAAGLLGVPVVVTEQYPKGLGPSFGGLIPEDGKALSKTSFDAMATPAIANRLSSAKDIVVIGCEAHICVVQTVVSLCDTGRRIWVVADATGSRTAANHQAALGRMAAQGAAIVTTEMVLFEWLRDANHPQFKAISSLIK